MSFVRFKIVQFLSQNTERRPPGKERKELRPRNFSAETVYPASLQPLEAPLLKEATYLVSLLLPHSSALSARPQPHLQDSPPKTSN
jgi:hypothetical protein